MVVGEVFTKVAGYLIAASIPLITGVGVYEYRRWRRNNRLRQAVISDLEATEIAPETAYSANELYLHDSIFRENVNNIGSLTESEISAIINYYAHLRKIRYEIFSRNAERLDNIPTSLVADAERHRAAALRLVCRQKSKYPYETLLH